MACAPARPAAARRSCPSATHHRHEAAFVQALLTREYDRAAAEMRTAIFLRGLVGKLFYGRMDEGHALFVAHLEGELAQLCALDAAGRACEYRISSGIFNSVKPLMYVPRWIRR